MVNSTHILIKIISMPHTLHTYQQNIISKWIVYRRILLVYKYGPAFVEPYKNLFSSTIWWIISKEMYAIGWGKWNEKKLHFYVPFGEGISLLFEILIWKKRIKRETLLHITRRCRYIHIHIHNQRRRTKRRKNNENEHAQVNNNNIYNETNLNKCNMKTIIYANGE